MILTVAAAVGGAHFVVPESPVRTPGRISWLAGAAAVRLAGRPARRGEPGAGLGLGLRPGDRPARGRGRAGRRAGWRSSCVRRRR